MAALICGPQGSFEAVLVPLAATRTQVTYIKQVILISASRKHQRPLSTQGGLQIFDPRNVGKPL